MLYGVSAALLSDIDNTWVAVLSEPLGLRALSRTIRYWSVAERNSGLPAVAGQLLANRALWLGVAAVLYAATFALFRTERSGSAGRRWGRKSALVTTAPAQRPSQVVVPRVVPGHGAGTAWRQFLHQVRFDTSGVLRSVPFLVLLILGLCNFLPGALFRQTLYGTPIDQKLPPKLANSDTSRARFCIVVVLMPILLLRPHRFRRAPSTAVA